MGNQLDAAAMVTNAKFQNDRPLAAILKILTFEILIILVPRALSPAVRLGPRYKRQRYSLQAQAA